MRRIPVSLLLSALLLADEGHAWTTTPARHSTPSLAQQRTTRSTVGPRTSAMAVAAAADAETTTVMGGGVAVTTTTTTTTRHNNNEIDSLTQDLISKLKFRELKQELERRQISAAGTMSQMRDRLRQAALPDEEPECIVNEDGMGDDCEDVVKMQKMGFTFVDESDPELEKKELMQEIESKAAQGHWKAATRKLKKLTRRFAEENIPERVFATVLEACMANRLQGARASESARKVMEQMVEREYVLTESTVNYCIKNCIGESGKESTHQGFGGIDTALAMLAAVETQQQNQQANGSSLKTTIIQCDTYDKLITALAKEGSIDHALNMLRSVIVDYSMTPPLQTFAIVAKAAVTTPGQDEKVLTLLAYSKAAGYELDTVANTADGRDMLAAGVIAAERLDNVALGLRLLTAASNAKGVAPDRGDVMVALSSSSAQRACTLLHKRAINRAVEDNQWKIAVRVLELMMERSLKPSQWLWRNVVTCCAKAEKSKKATALLLDWVKLYERGQAERPPLSVFNTCVNACEICNEMELTLVVLDAMKKVHDTDGNIITFNIALKRLAKQGNFRACEGIIVGMLQAGVEPTVVSYTTAIAACVSGESKQPVLAYEWIKRMRSRNVMPNVISYNTAMAACVDGKLDSTYLGSKLATEMLNDVEMQLAESEDDRDEFTNLVPDMTTKYVARQLMQQLKKNWEEGAIEKSVATQTTRVPLLKLIDFQKSEAAAKARERAAQKQQKLNSDGDRSLVAEKMEVELEIAAGGGQRTAEV